VPPTTSDILEGYGVFRPDTRLYHTYVLSSAKDEWGCHGWPTSGRRICKGRGSATVARCIDGKDDAGIFYLRTGVCHQIANRILSPAGVAIPPTSHVQVRSSHLVWGRFGGNYSWVPPANRWPDRKQQCQPPLAGAISGSESSSSTEFSSGIRGSMTQPPSGAELPDSRSELSSLIKAGLGHSVDEKTLLALAKMQEHLQDQIGHLSGLLMEHKIAPRRYLEELDRALSEASKTGERLMGSKEDFHRVFGELRADQLGDVSAFLEQYSGPHKKR
jgi:hypothetical protein